MHSGAILSLPFGPFPFVTHYPLDIGHLIHDLPKLINVRKGRPALLSDFFDRADQHAGIVFFMTIDADNI